MRCFVATKKGTQCAHGITSGNTFTWYQYMVRTCTQHGEMVRSGTLLLNATTVVYKGEVCTTPAHAVCEALELDLHVDTTPTPVYVAPATTHGVRCGTCSATHGTPTYHANVDDVRACYVRMYRDSTPVHDVRTHMGSMRAPTPTPTMQGTSTMGTTRAVLCGACKKQGVQHPYHPTIEDVRACYAGVYATQ